MDVIQIAIFIVLITISACSVAVTVYFVFLLKDLKLTISKTNNILDDTKQISNSLAQPFNSFSEFVAGFKNGVSLFNSLFEKDKKNVK